MTPTEHINAAEGLLAHAQTLPAAWPERTSLLLEAQVHLGLAEAKKNTRRTAKKEQQ